jgi:hypothetical protein
MHSRLIGIASDTGDLNWFNWWDFPDPLLSLAHVLSRGASWFFWNSDLSTKENRGDRAWNQMSFSYASKVRSRFRSAGLLIKKEDRGKRFVIFPSTLAQKWFTKDMEQRGFVPCSRVKSGVRVYFLPKTHKPLPLQGRLVEACGSHVRPLKLPVAPWSVRDVALGVQHFAVDPRGDPAHRFSGDIEKMFPSIPVPELCSLLRNRGAPVGADVVERVFDAYRLTFGSHSYAVPVGLPIGHPWSPALADFYLASKEEPFVASLPPDVKFRRYADDTLFSVPCASSVSEDDVRRRYEQAAAPLRVTWQTDDDPSFSFKFLDARFASRATRRAPFRNAAAVPHLGPFQPPGGTLPQTFVMTSIVGRALRVAAILRPHHPKWSAARDLLSGDIRHPVADRFLSQLTDGDWAHSIRGSINLCVRRIEKTSDTSPERPRLWITFCPFWLSPHGKRKLVRLRKNFQIRWNLCGIRRLQHLV